MKVRHISNKSFIKNAKNFERRVHKHIFKLIENSETHIERQIGETINLLIIPKLIDGLILNYKRNPYRKMSAFVYKIPTISDINLYEIKVWYDFEYENGKLIFKYSEKILHKKFKRKVQLVLKYSDKN